MYAIKIIPDRVHEYKFICCVYNELEDVIKETNKYSQKNFSYEILNLESITDFPFYIIEIENEFTFVQNELELRTEIEKLNLESMIIGDGDYFRIYEIDKFFSFEEGKDEMGTLLHHHVDDENLNKFISLKKF